MTPSAEQYDGDGLVARDRRDELRRRRESSRQVNATEEDCGGELLVGVQWLEIVMGEKPPSVVATSCSRR
uniref:Uncharacterized protein n=1 Tax=Brassica oleracea var. oleracea TaxID=109376 RepID=A0A0D3BWT9_BRAOL